MPRSIVGKTSIDEEFWTSAFWVLDEGGPRSARLLRGLSFGASGGEFRSTSGIEGRPCWAGLWQKASIAGYQSFLCALSAIVSATFLIAPLALPTAF
jgi:hypothetical protein